MNSQINYILQAFLFLLLLLVGYWVVSPLRSLQFNHDDNKRVIDYYTPQQEAQSVSTSFLNGKNLFQSKCAACHNLFKNMTGPALGSFLERGPWSDRKQLYKWVRNPEVFMKTDPYTKALKKQYGSLMTAFPNLSDGEIDAITEYVTGTNSTAVY